MPGDPRPIRLKLVALGIVVAGLVLDLWTKSHMQDFLGLDPNVPGSKVTREVIPGFLEWRGNWNEGITFGFFQGATEPILLLTAAASLGILLWFVLTRNRSRLLHVALALVLSGAIGNLHDRWTWHKVRDFIQLYFWGWPYPAFNVADSMIVVGVILILWREMFGRREPKKHAEPAPPPAPAGTAP